MSTKYWRSSPTERQCGESGTGPAAPGPDRSEHVALRLPVRAARGELLAGDCVPGVLAAAGD